MLENWIKPITAEDFMPKTPSIDPIGKYVSVWDGKQTNLPEGRLVLIGLDPKTADPVRQAFYALSSGDRDVPLIDLGNLRDSKLDTLSPVLAECLLGDLIPIIIGGNQNLALAQVKGFQHVNKQINLCYLGERIPMQQPYQKKPGFLEDALQHSEGTVVQTSVLGFQTHFCDALHIDYLQKRQAELLRLGLLKSHPELAEPLFRDAQTAVFNLDVIRNADFPAQQTDSPNGIDAELACQLAYYAGISDPLQSIGFYGLDSEHSGLNISANLLAQMVWYFIQGFKNRYSDFPDQSTDQFVKYVVDIKGYDKPLTFIKSKKSERWWFQSSLSPSGWIACLYDDYKMASKGELSDRYFNALARNE